MSSARSAVAMTDRISEVMSSVACSSASSQGKAAAGEKFALGNARIMKMGRLAVVVLVRLQHIASEALQAMLLFGIRKARSKADIASTILASRSAVHFSTLPSATSATTFWR